MNNYDCDMVAYYDNQTTKGNVKPSLVGFEYIIHTLEAEPVYNMRMRNNLSLQAHIK